jgi:hypothetical protein
MDANPVSTSENTFDAALRALEDLETNVAQSREEKPAAAGLAPSDPIPSVAMVALSEIEADPQPAAITAVPIAEIAAPRSEPAPAPAPAPAAPIALAAPAEPLGKFGRMAVWLGLASSMISAAGLIVAERTIMRAQLVVADARERARELEQSNRLVRQLEVVRNQQIDLLRQQQQQALARPVTSAELQHEMDVLQTGLLTRDPMNRVVQAIQAGQVENNARFNEFGMKMERVEAAVGRR